MEFYGKYSGGYENFHTLIDTYKVSSLGTTPTSKYVKTEISRIQNIMGQQRTWKTTRALKSRYCLTFSTIVSPTKACLPKRGQYTSKPYIVANHDQYKENRLTFILVLHHWCCSFFFNFFPTNTLKSCLQKCECFTTNGIKYLFQLISDPQQRFVAL